jgi:rubrerythrin
MNVEEAIHMALDYETKVRDLYIDAMKKTNDAQGKKIFQTMAKEEQGHLDYLNSRLDHLKETGEVDNPELGTLVPNKEVITAGVQKLESGMAKETKEDEISLLKKALEMENETSTFYRKVVGELDGEGKAMFSRFMEIEEGHLAIVQAEIDSLTGAGYWFDFPDISFEAG